MPQQKVNVAPFIAIAIARNDRAYARARMLYYERQAECEAALYKNQDYRHEAITSCRVEYQIKARQVLGVIYVCEVKSILDVIKRGWPHISRVINNAGASPVAFRGRDLIDDSDPMDLAFIGFFYARLTEKPTPPEIEQCIVSMSDLYAHRVDFIADTKTLNLSFGKKAFPNSKYTGTAALENAEGDGQIPQAAYQLADAKGIFLSDYLAGLSLSDEDKALAVSIAGEDRNLIPVLGLFALLYKAIKADRKYMLQNHRESIQADLAVANQEAARAVHEKKAVEEKFAALTDTIAELKTRINDLEVQKSKLEHRLSEHDGDAQELSSLRSALYSAEQEDEQLAEVETFTPPTQRIVCIGGHQRWVSQMAKALPNIRFISADVTLDYNVLNDAEAVWFKVDYMSHSQYTPAPGSSSSSFPGSSSSSLWLFGMTHSRALFRIYVLPFSRQSHFEPTAISFFAVGKYSMSSTRSQRSSA